MAVEVRLSAPPYSVAYGVLPLGFGGPAHSTPYKRLEDSSQWSQAMMVTDLRIPKARRADPRVARNEVGRAISFPKAS